MKLAASRTALAEPHGSSSTHAGGLLQRKCACGGAASPLTGECEACGRKHLQRKAAGDSDGGSVPPIVHEVLRSPGQPLDDRTRAFMEPRFGHSFGDVRVHTDEQAARSADAVSALAYTVGGHIAFARHQFAPDSAAGRELLAHELVHTIQQSPSLSDGELEIEPAKSAAETEAGNVAASICQLRQVSVERGSKPKLAMQEGEVPGPSPLGPLARAEETDEFKDVGWSKERGREGLGARATWGWGSPETNNLYHECQIVELERIKFVAFVKSLPKAPARGREKPLNAEEVLGIVSFDPRKAVPPAIAAQAVQDKGKTAFKLKPTHAEMPPLRSASTKAGNFVEGTRQYVDEECKNERARLGTSKFPVHWTVTTDGAQRIKEAEQEHCNDIRLAFDWTLGLYASRINTVAAAERIYRTEQQAVTDAIKYIGVQPDEMLLKFHELAIKTRDRDDQDWHTANQKLSSRAHRQQPTPENGCRQTEKLDASSFPDVDSKKHPSESVLSATQQPGGSGRKRKLQRSAVAGVTQMLDQDQLHCAGGRSALAIDSATPLVQWYEADSHCGSFEESRAMTGEPWSDGPEIAAVMPGPADGAVPTSGELPGSPSACVVHAFMPYARSGIIRTPTGSVFERFEVRVEWSSAEHRGETSYCAAECGEYHQFIKGYMRSSPYKDGSDLVDVSEKVFGGKPLDQNLFQEDGLDRNPNARYGHRKEKQTANEKYEPDRATGTKYVGWDSPGVFIGTFADFDVTFLGKLVDTCNGTETLSDPWRVFYRGVIRP
jgi:hypothetical protein